MSMTKAQTNKLLTQLSGKQAFLVITQNFIERSLNEPITFTDTEIKCMMNAVWSNPERAYEFKRYNEANDVMHVAMYEGRLASAEAITHMLLQIMLISQISHNHKPHKEVISWADEHINMLQRQHASILHWLEWVQVWQQLLQAFDAVFSINMTDMLAQTKQKLELFITMYHDRMGSMEHHVTYARIKAAEEAKASQDIIDALSAKYVAADEAWQLPKPEKATADHPTLQRCITFLHQCPEKEIFHKVLEVVGV